MKKILALFVGALLAFGAVAVVPVALAHAEITECTPAIDGSVETAPEKLTCETSQGMKAEGSSLQVVDADGMQVDKGDSAVDLNDPDRTIISVTLDTAKMKDGVYTVKWTTVSADDGDEASGEFHFTVGHAMTEQPTPAATEEHTEGESHEEGETHQEGGTHADDHSMASGTIDGKQVVQIIAPAKDATVPAGDVKIEASVEGVTLGENDTHLHFYVDGKLAGMGDGAQTTYTVNLEPGKHDIEVGLATGEHQDAFKAHVHVTVEGAASATPTTSNEGTTQTIPATGGIVDYGVFALVTVFGMLLVGTGALLLVRKSS